MKRFLLAALLLTGLLTQNVFGQNSSSLSQLLDKYYGIKDALVNGKADLAATNATEFIKVANSIDYKQISEGNINALLKDATIISEAKELSKQRLQFANLSNNMITVAKAVKISADPVYVQYCPMKKASWLSNAAEIKNPYYGSSMLSCGKVTETIKP